MQSFPWPLVGSLSGSTGGPGEAQGQRQEQAQEHSRPLARVQESLEVRRHLEGCP